MELTSIQGQHLNIQALTSGDGSLLWVSDALPGALAEDAEERGWIAEAACPVRLHRRLVQPGTHPERAGLAVPG